MPAADQSRLPRIGVLIPTRNRLHTLPAALQSVLAQTWTDLEVLVMDDGSTDGTWEYLCALKDPRVHFHRVENGGSAAKARNAGLSLLCNEWIAFQDSDDQWLPDKLEKQMQAVDAAPEPVGLVSARISRGVNGTDWVFPPPSIPLPPTHAFEDMLRGNRISTAATIIRRDCIDRYGDFDESLPALEDWEYFLRLARNVPVAFVDEVLVYAPQSADSISQNLQNNIQAFQQILERVADDLTRRPAIKAMHFGTLADLLCMAGRWTEGRAFYREAARLNHRHIGHAAGCILTYCPPVYRWARNKRIDPSWKDAK